MKNSRHFRRRLAAVALTLVLGLPVIQENARMAAGPQPETVQTPQLVKAERLIAETPLYFEPNVGQTDPKVRFIARGAGAMTFLTDSEMVVVLRKALEEPAPVENGDRPMRDTRPRRVDSEVVSMRLAGAAANPAVAGVEELPSFSAYFIGDDPSKWLNRVAHYSKVSFTNVYPNIDLVYHGTRGKLEYDFIVKPGADPSRIELQFEGVRSTHLEAGGGLLLTTRLGQIRQHRPKVYQMFGDRVLEIPASYKIRSGRVGFDLSGYDRSRPLVIDPVVEYSIYLGGTDNDEAAKISVDSLGAAYIVGTTDSVDFPTQVPLMTDRSHSDVFVTKILPNGQGLSWSTYLGGHSPDVGSDIDLENNGSDIYVTGTTESSSFPTRLPYQGNQIGADAFVTKLNFSNGFLGLAYSTYLGGNGDDKANTLAVRNGYVAVAGTTHSSNFPAVYAIQGNQAESDAFVTVLKPQTTEPVQLYYSTYLGGGSEDGIWAVYWDQSGSGDLLVCGFAFSPRNFPLIRSLQGFGGNTQDGFVARIKAGTLPPQPPKPSLVFSTFLGGDGIDSPRAITGDASGAVYVAGFTYSSDFPLMNPYDNTINNAGEGFVSKIVDNGVSLNLAFSTYFGGNLFETIPDITVDPSGHAMWVVVESHESDLPVISTGWWKNKGLDVYVARFGIDASNHMDIDWSGYLGSDLEEFPLGIARRVIGGQTYIYVTGSGGIGAQTNYDALVIKIRD